MTAQIAATPDAESGSALLSPQRRNFVFLAIMLGMLMAALDQTIVATALPTIVADLGDAGHQSWVVTSYLLASTIITALAGRLGDLFGRKRVFQAAVTFFVVGSALCGIAQSMAMLVGARALQGLGGGAITVTATALIGEIIPLRDRGRYQGALGAVFGVTTVIGPLLGGYFTDHLSWRWAFYVNVPLSIVVFFVAAAAIPSLAGRGKPVIDYTGILFVGLGAFGLASLWTRRHRAPAPPPPGAQVPKEQWTMAPLALLARPRWSTGRKAAMLTLRAYLVVSVVLLIVKAFQLGGG